jgi:D-3-phosphoglycerate dehydrogenase
MRIYIAVPDYSAGALTTLHHLTGDITVRPPGPRATEAELCRLVDEYDVLIIGAKERMTRGVFNSIGHLKVLGTLSIATDHIDERFLNDTRIAVLNCPTSNVVSVAEHTFALILALFKKLPQGHVAVLSQAGRAGLHGLPNDLAKRVIGVVGAGRIGSRVLELALAFGLRTICHTLHPHDHATLLERGVQFVDLPTLFSESDIVTLHVPLTDSTHRMVTRELIGLLQPHAVFVNTARMDVVDNNALFDQLRKGKILGVGIDAEIPPDELPRLATLNGLILTPHVAGITNEAIVRMDFDLAESILAQQESLR